MVGFRIKLWVYHCAFTLSIFQDTSWCWPVQFCCSAAPWSLRQAEDLASFFPPIFNIPVTFSGINFGPRWYQLTLKEKNMALKYKMKNEIAQEPPFCWFLYSSFPDGWTFSVEYVLLWNMLPNDLCSTCTHHRVQKLMTFITMLRSVSSSKPGN